MKLRDALFATAVGVAVAAMPLAVTSPQTAKAAKPAVYGNCPTDGDALCRLYHGVESRATRWCTYDTCFEMNYGDEIRVVAADERGDFPRTWFTWSEERLTHLPGTPYPCDLTREGKTKTRVEIPEPGFRCTAALSTGEDLYHEHFASNPTSGCLAWIECKE
jgi:hypothetical protein